ALDARPRGGLDDEGVVGGRGQARRVIVGVAGGVVLVGEVASGEALLAAAAGDALDAGEGGEVELLLVAPRRLDGEEAGAADVGRSGEDDEGAPAAVGALLRQQEHLA